jgi:hypothetical protein
MAAKADRRAFILARSFDILSNLIITISTGVIPAGHIVHNRGELPEELRPGLIFLDADEVRDPRYVQNAAGRSTPPKSGMMRMTPEIYAVLDDRKPANLLVSEDLLLMRTAVLNALFTDPQLQQFTGAEGSIVYDGCVTDLARNRQMKGQMGLSITFGYPFIPGELATA